MSVALYDSHCHLDYEAFDADREAMMARARAAGVTHVLVPGVDRDQWRSTIDGHGIEIVRAIGVHPQAIDATSDDAIAEIAVVARQSNAVAIGEIGWDTRRASAPIERQIEIADAQLELARQLALPILLHVVGAHGLALERLDRYGPFEAGGVVHAYSGPAALLERYLALGLSIAFGPSVTRKNARRPIEAAIATPLDRLLIETDGPDQFPADKPDRRGEPADLTIVIDALARAKNDPPERIASASYENAVRLFSRRLAPAPR